MKRTLVILVLAFTVVAVLLVGYATWTDRIIWFTYVRTARIEVNGAIAEGYVHHSSRLKTMIVTRTTDNGKRESYRVHPSTQAGVSIQPCNKWVAPRLPLFPTNPSKLCWDAEYDEYFRLGGPHERMPDVPHAFDILTSDGERLHVSW